MVSRTYRCLACLDGTVERSFDVSHLTVTCEACGEFSRFVHEGVYERFQAFEEEPPAELDWGRLGKMEKFVVAEKIVREGKTLEDFEVDSHDDGESATDDAPAGDSAGSGSTPGGPTDSGSTSADASPEDSAGSDSTAGVPADDSTESDPTVEES